LRASRLAGVFLLALILAGRACPVQAGPGGNGLAAEDRWLAWVGHPDDPQAMFQRSLEAASPGSSATVSLPPAPLDHPKAGFLSLVVPGASQIRDHRITGFVMLGAEVGAWFAYQALRSGGHDRESSAEHMAQSAYSVDAYKKNAAAAGQSPATVEQNAAQLADWQSNSPSEFFDAIGRDPNFVYGWSDYQVNAQNPSIQQGLYLKRRDDSNRLLQNANTVLSAVVLNHVISAVDAFRAAKNLKRQAPLGFLMSVHMDPFSGRANIDFTRHLW
jgi:hypothetical protein